MKSISNEEEKIRFIEQNIKLVDELDKMNEEEYELAREEILYNNFVRVYKDNSNSFLVGFMGMYHTKSDLLDYNLKQVLEQKNPEIKIFSVDILYKDTLRTIKEDDIYSIISINDEFEESKYNYNKYYNIYINDFNGVLLRTNCKSLKMLER